MSGLVVSLCDCTGNMVRPWADAGYECLCLDTQHSIRADRREGNITYRWGDVRSLVPRELGAPAIVFAFPPCTHLAVSGARDFERKGLRLLIDGLEIVEACRQLCEWGGCPWMLENPVSRLATLWRKPDHYFDPWQYAGWVDDIQAENYTKKTSLWTGGGFVMPPTRPAPEPHRHDIHDMAPSDDRADRRSATPMGFAQAVFAANHLHIQARAA